ncbi:intradiol ring-cleavage dioxygenase [Dyadobacter sp. CY326]|uniref:intradiol ring-cleavage dioxygenase n=1 Tax=Dyadobacter sp. CY326 TaxID=2907300 RepID=UPI001F29EDDB|nr:intradiol ring-cleavage dioxygenase [Dyadobacter sp. CY326]MCE7068638.1 intradiol ring-cleavage dioxygenase [Dyadobacter sp. CY326]
MERKEFLRRGFSALSLAAIVPLISCTSDTIDPEAAGLETSSGACTATASETAGPFPTKSPSALVSNDITSDRPGTKLSIKITIQNLNNNCEGLAGALVDIWHCDATGNYSEYGGSGMQSTDYTNVHFLRGRQTTDANGLVTFTSIYPGWYSGRAPHIHVHVYNASGKSLLVTQIAFPEAISKVVYAQGVYASHGQADTTNARDNVFSDGTSTEMSTVTGSTSAGYELTHAIVVSA